MRLTRQLRELWQRHDLGGSRWHVGRSIHQGLSGLQPLHVGQGEVDSAGGVGLVPGPAAAGVPARWSQIGVALGHLPSGWQNVRAVRSGGIVTPVDRRTVNVMFAGDQEAELTPVTPSVGTVQDAGHQRACRKDSDQQGGAGDWTAWTYPARCGNRWRLRRRVARRRVLVALVVREGAQHGQRGQVQPDGDPVVSTVASHAVEPA